MLQPAYKHELVPGTRLEGFEIASVLGTGGFGITYRAFDHSLQRDVAIKEYLPTGLAVRGADNSTVMPRSESDQDGYDYGLRRFLDEARTLARFNHPSIVRVSRYLEANGTAYLVMDYEQGQTLGGWLERNGTLNEAQATGVLVWIMRGLSAVHSTHYLHRDIKPPNVFLRVNGPPLLLDFGAARQALAGKSQPLTAMLTPGYAPLEQYHAEERQGPWSDIYAAAATLYHCVSGLAPMAATQRLADEHEGYPDRMEERLKRLQPSFSRGFVEVLSWMLKPYPKQRPQSAERVLKALGAQAEGFAVELPPVAETAGAGDGAQAPTVELESSERSRPLAPSAASPAPPPAPAATVLPEHTLTRITTVLEQYVGSAAPGLVQRAARQAGDETELTEFLSDFIPDPSARTAFVAATVREGSGPQEAETRLSPSSGTQAGDSASAIPQAFISDAESALAAHLGPIAKVLVKRAAKRAASPGELGRMLAREIGDPGEREAFLARIQS